MAFPPNSQFDRYAQLTYGLDAYGIGYGVGVNYLAIITGFMYGYGWQYCGPTPVTVWLPCGVAPVTTWSLVAGGNGK